MILPIATIKNLPETKENSQNNNQQTHIQNNIPHNYLRQRMTSCSLDVIFLPVTTN